MFHGDLMTLKFRVIFVLALLSSVLMIAWRLFVPIDAFQKSAPIIVDISKSRSPIKNNTPPVFQEKLPLPAVVPTAQIIVPTMVSLPKAEPTPQIIAPTKEIELVNLELPLPSQAKANSYSAPSYSNNVNTNKEVLPRPKDKTVNEKTESVTAPLFPIFPGTESKKTNTFLKTFQKADRNSINATKVFQEKKTIQVEILAPQVNTSVNADPNVVKPSPKIISSHKEIKLLNQNVGMPLNTTFENYPIQNNNNDLIDKTEAPSAPDDKTVNEKTGIATATLFPIFPATESKKTDGLPIPYLMEDPNVINAGHNHQITLGIDGEIILVQGCSSCGKGTIGSGGGLGAGGSHLSGGAVNCGPEGCTPGRHNCYPWEHNKTFAGRMAGAMYEALCCPDPCYEGKWIPLADSAFYSDSIRPISQQKLRWDIGRNLVNPTRNAYMFAPNPIFPYPVQSLNYNDVYISTEIATGGFSILSDISYRTLSIDPSEGGGAFGDMMIGTKSLLFDTELIQIAMEFKTFLPTGNFTAGFGTGHVSLEPSLLVCLKLKEKTYLQGQVSEWIPLGSTTPPVGTAGSLLHAHLSLNHVLHEVNPDIPIIGTLEYSGYYFQAGGNQDVSSIPTGSITTSSSTTPATNNFYASSSSGSSSGTSVTTPSLPFSNSSGISYQYIGPGLRMFMGSHYDMGVGAQFALSGNNRFAEQLYRVEFRLRY